MSTSLLDPALLSRVSDLELVARIIVEGLVSGLHRSPFHGYSAEFSQYRHYRQGDDLKYLDWKLLARTDRLFTKQFRETTNMAAQVVLDCSGSMAFPEGDASKFRYGTFLAAVLSYLIAAQGDAIGLVADRGEQPIYIGARAGRAHLRRVLATLAALHAAGPSAADQTIGRAAELLKRRGLLLVISDFYDNEEATFTELKRAVRRGHEVAVFHVMSRQEIEFPYREAGEFEDLETAARTIVNPAAVRSAYRDAVAEFVERWRRRAGAEGIDYTLAVTDTPPDETLRKYLLRQS
jgi:uncharacterized protein (DUF58 family)